MTRFLKYSTYLLRPLKQNIKHNFAQDHALNIYKSKSIYSFIPKNACSTMRLSVAKVNGCIKDLKDFKWIHANNAAFVANLGDLARASYAFTILRDPFSRLTSVYLDKMLNKNAITSRFTTLYGKGIGYDDVTFELFVKSLANSKIRESNVHWRPQIDFLVYDEYDDYFSVEDFKHACVTLKTKIDLDVIDARPLTKHQTSGYKVLAEHEPYRLSPTKLLAYKKQGYAPSPESMFNDDLIETVTTTYGCDIDLYKDKISSNGLTLCHKLLLSAR